MALVSYVTTPEAPDKVRTLFESIEKKGAPVSNFLRTIAHSPELFDAFLAIDGALRKMKLEMKLRELAYIKTSELNGCEYCLHHHKQGGKRAGLTDRQLEETRDFETSDAYDELQRDVLRYAEAVTRHINVDDELAQRLKRSLSDRELVELAATVGIANFTNRVTETLRLELP